MANLNPSTVAPKTHNVSAKYVVIDSEKLITELTKRGFELRAILSQKSGRGTHVIRMRSTTPYVMNGEEMYPEIVMKNSYDKSTAFSVEMGIFRLVCSNGLTILAEEYGAARFKTKHIDSEAQIAEEITMNFSNNLPAVWQVQERLATFKLTEKQTIELAMKAAEIRWNKKFTAKEAKVLLQAARPEDEGNTAWLVFNRLQENIIQGGVKLEGMKRTPKPINHAYRNALVNEALFASVYEMVGAGSSKN